MVHILYCSSYSVMIKLALARMGSSAIKSHSIQCPMTRKLSPFHSADHSYCASYTNTPLYPYTPHTIYREFLTVSNSTTVTEHFTRNLDCVRLYCQATHMG